MAAWWKCPGPGDFFPPDEPDEELEQPQEAADENFDPDDYEDMGHGRLMQRI